jgi:hypothetical protein
MPNSSYVDSDDEVEVEVEVEEGSEGASGSHYPSNESRMSQRQS